MEIKDFENRRGALVIQTVVRFMFEDPWDRGATKRVWPRECGKAEFRITISPRDLGDSWPMVENYNVRKMDKMFSEAYVKAKEEFLRQAEKAREMKDA